MIEFTRKEIESAIEDLTTTIEIRRESYIKNPDEFTAKRIIEAQNRRIVLSLILQQEGEIFSI